MKVQIICEDCGNIVELTPETLGNTCYVQSKLVNANMTCDVITETDITMNIDEIKELDDLDGIDTETTLDYIRFNCKNCGGYIELNNLT